MNMSENPFQDLDDTDIDGDSEETTSPDTALDSLDITTPVDESQEVDQTPALNFDVSESSDDLGDIAPEVPESLEFPDSPDVSEPQIDTDFPPNQFAESDAEDFPETVDMEETSAGDLPGVSQDTQETSAGELPEFSQGTQETPTEDLPGLTSEQSEDPDSLPDIDFDTSGTESDFPERDFSVQNVTAIPNFSFSESPPRPLIPTGYKTAGTYYGS